MKCQEPWVEPSLTLFIIPRHSYLYLGRGRATPNRLCLSEGNGHPVDLIKTPLFVLFNAKYKSQPPHPIQHTVESYLRYISTEPFHALPLLARLSLVWHSASSPSPGASSLSPGASSPSPTLNITTTVIRQICFGVGLR